MLSCLLYLSDFCGFIWIFFSSIAADSRISCADTCTFFCTISISSSNSADFLSSIRISAVPDCFVNFSPADFSRLFTWHVTPYNFKLANGSYSRALSFATEVDAIAFSLVLFSLANSSACSFLIKYFLPFFSSAVLFNSAIALLFFANALLRSFSIRAFFATLCRSTSLSVDVSSVVTISPTFFSGNQTILLLD